MILLILLFVQIYHHFSDSESSSPFYNLFTTPLTMTDYPGPVVASLLVVAGCHTWDLLWWSYSKGLFLCITHWNCTSPLLCSPNQLSNMFQKPNKAPGAQGQHYVRLWLSRWWPVVEWGDDVIKQEGNYSTVQYSTVHYHLLKRIILKF